MNLYKSIRGHKLWYSPLYYVLLGYVFTSVWNSTSDHWGLPQTFWQGLTVVCIAAVAWDTKRYFQNGDPQPVFNNGNFKHD